MAACREPCERQQQLACATLLVFQRCRGSHGDVMSLMQVLLSIQLGNFQELSSANVSPPPVISELEGQLEALPADDELPYSWLPAAGLRAMVQLLAAVILKPTGKVKAAMLHITRGNLFVLAWGCSALPHQQP